jgi:hypothetical protein
LLLLLSVTLTPAPSFPAEGQAIEVFRRVTLAANQVK